MKKIESDKEDGEFSCDSDNDKEKQNTDNC